MTNEIVGKILAEIERKVEKQELDIKELQDKIKDEDVKMKYAMMKGAVYATGSLILFGVVLGMIQ